MQQHSYQAQQLAPLIESLRDQKATGVLHLIAQIGSEQKTRSRALVFAHGGVTYGGTNVPSNEEFARKLGQKFNPDLIKVALDVAKKKVDNSNSVRSLLEELVRVRTFTWEQVEALIHTRIVWTLEQILPYPGEYHFERDTKFDLCYQEACLTLDWSKILSDVVKRQQAWASLAPTISSMEAVPRLPQSLTKLPNAAVRQHLQQWVDGKRSLVDIAEQLDKDPLQIASSYLKWAQADWVAFEGSHHSVPSESDQQATILSVDDSPIVQVTIKRALGDRYNLLLADNAADALNLLNQKDVSLLLLDVTMPDIDGFEVCRYLRKIPKFRQLPIIMLTAKDGFTDKIKGKFAGTNHYLTKPFDQQQLIELIEKYLNRN